MKLGLGLGFTREGGINFTNLANTAPIYAVEETSPGARSLPFKANTRYAVGIVYETSVSDAEDVDIYLTGDDNNQIYTGETLDPGEIENTSSDYSVFIKNFTWVGSAGDVDLSISPSTSSSAVVQGIIVWEADPMSGLVEQHGSQKHSHSSVIMYNGKPLQTHVELWTNNVGLSYNGRPVKVGSTQFLPIPSLSPDLGDRYHTTAVLCEVAGGIAVITTNHNGTIQGVWAETISGLFSATPFTISTLASNTYASVDVIDSTVYIFTRCRAVTNGGGFYIVTNIDTTPSVQLDFLHDVQLTYPRNINVIEDDAGNKGLFYAWQGRTGANWNGVYCATYWPDEGAAGQHRDINGNALGSNSAYGTTGSPRFSSSEYNTEIQSGTGCRLVGPLTSGVRYTGGRILAKVEEWNVTTKQVNVLAPFVDVPTAGALYYDDAVDLRILMQVGSTRTVTANDVNPFGIRNPQSYRLDWDIKWQDNDPTTDNVEFVFCNRRDRQSGTNRFGDLIYGLYMDWGATMLTKCLITDPFGAADAAALAATVSDVDSIEFNTDIGENNTTRLSVSNPQYIPGTNYLVAQAAQGQLHENQTSGQRVIFDMDKTYEGPDYGDGGRELLPVIYTSNDTQLTGEWAAMQGDTSVLTFGICLWVRENPNFADDMIFLRGQDIELLIDIQETATLRILARDSAAGLNQIEWTAGGLPLSSDTGWVHLWISIDTTQASLADRIKCYANNTPLTEVTTSCPQNYEIRIAERMYDLFKRTTAPTAPLNAYIAYLFMYCTAALDIADANVRSLFYDSNTGKPGNFGADGNTPGFSLNADGTYRSTGDGELKPSIFMKGPSTTLASAFYNLAQSGQAITFTSSGTGIVSRPDIISPAAYDVVRLNSFPATTPAINDQDMIVLATGQSLQDRLFTADSGAGDTALKAEAALYVDGTITHTDAAATNQFLTKSSYDASGETGGRYYWDDETSSKGPRYTAEIDPVANKSTYNVINIDLGQSDGINTSFPHTKAEYKTYWKEFLAQLNSDFPNATIFVNILNRTRQSGDFDATYNLVRQVQIELPDEVSYVERGIDCYDLPMTDNFHFTSAGAEIYARRQARLAASLFGVRTNSGNYGPLTSSYQWNTDYIDFDIEHDGGTDWTAPSSGTGQWGIEIDGTSDTDFAVTRIDATTGRISFTAGNVPTGNPTLEAFVNYGDGGALAATPDVALDNSVNTMPFGSQYDIAVVDNDPLRSLDNVDFRVHARAGTKVYSSSNIIETISALDGSGFAEVTAGNGPEFTTDYIEYARNTDRLLSDDVLTTSSTRTLGIACKLPDTLPSFGTIFGFTNSSGGWSNNARLYLLNGFLEYQSVDSGDNELHSIAVTGGGNAIIFLRFNSESSLEGFINSKTATATLDPSGTYTLASRKASFGEASNQPANALAIKKYDSFLTSDAITDQELSDIFDYWNEQFNMGL